MKRIIVLGSTGSIGASTLEVVRALADRLRVVGLACRRQSERFARQVEEFAPAAAAIAEPAAASIGLPAAVRLYRGPEAVIELVRRTEADLVLNGIAGAAGLLPSFAALEAGCDLALANKESVVLAGPLLLAEARRRGRRILPVDSEHAALASLLRGLAPASVAELLLTASGGAFRDLPLDQLGCATFAEAMVHPTWRMGPRITIDSATLANKGLEVIEANRLFDVPLERVKVLLHPPSLVHGMVRTVDGTLRLEASTPDMRIPIQNALMHPEVLPTAVPWLELAGRQLSFAAVDPRRYPLLDLAYRAAAGPASLPIVYNAVDEVAVQWFSEGRIPFTRIATLVQEVLAGTWPPKAGSVEAVLAIDAEARGRAREALP